MAYGASPSRPRKKNPRGVLPQVQQNIQKDARNRMMGILPEGGGGMMFGSPELAFQNAGSTGNLLLPQMGMNMSPGSASPWMQAQPGGQGMTGGPGFSPMLMGTPLSMFPSLTPSYGGGFGFA